MTSNLGGGSPFLTARAQARAPQVLEYASATGAAALVSPNGRIALSAGSAADLDLERIVRTARLLGAAHSTVGFRAGDVCVQAGPVRLGWSLCIVSLSEVSPNVTAERLQKAAHVLGLALVDGLLPGGGGGTPDGPAHAQAAAVALSGIRGRRPSALPGVRLREHVGN